MLMVTHDGEDAVTLAGRVLVMASSPGRIRREIVVPSEDSQPPARARRHSRMLCCRHSPREELPCRQTLQHPDHGVDLGAGVVERE